MTASASPKPERQQNLRPWVRVTSVGYWSRPCQSEHLPNRALVPRIVVVSFSWTLHEPKPVGRIFDYHIMDLDRFEFRNGPGKQIARIIESDNLWTFAGLI